MLSKLKIYFLPLLLIALNACSLFGSKDTLIGNNAKLTISYVESEKAFPNPERGFYGHYAFNSADPGQGLSTATIKAQRAQGRTLLLNLYYLRDFRDKSISNEYLNLIERNMQALREGGAKCVLRFAYTSDTNDTPWDPPTDIVAGHIEQLKPILQEYVDVIYVLEAGFVGVWGEWYYTSNFNMSPSSDNDYTPRRNLLNALLDALPQERMICVRTPQFKLKCLNLNFSDTITKAEAYNGSNKSRISAHNDCFLASKSDMGTFDNNAQRTYWQSDTKYTIMGGETCAVSEFSNCSNAIEQMENYHWSYINSGYHGTVLKNWKTDACFDEIERRLGYRLVLTDAIFTKEPASGKSFTAQFNLKNVGFAAPANPRDVELIFISTTDKNDKHVVKTDIDPRFWFPGEDISFTIDYDLNKNMSGKSFDIYLNLPDPKQQLKEMPEFSIRLANENVWNEDLGYNKVHSIDIK